MAVILVDCEDVNDGKSLNKSYSTEEITEKSGSPAKGRDWDDLSNGDKMKAVTYFVEEKSCGKLTAVDFEE